MQAVWARVLKGLRESEHYALFALVASLEDLTFTNDQVIIQTGDAAEYQMLHKNLALINQIAGQDCVVVNAPVVTDYTAGQAYVEKLQELFGDKIEIL